MDMGYLHNVSKIEFDTDEHRTKMLITHTERGDDTGTGHYHEITLCSELVLFPVESEAGNNEPIAGVPLIDACTACGCIQFNADCDECIDEAAQETMRTDEPTTCEECGFCSADLAIEFNEHCTLCVAAHENAARIVVNPTPPTPTPNATELDANTGEDGCVMCGAEGVWLGDQQECASCNPTQEIPDEVCENCGTRSMLDGETCENCGYTENPKPTTDPTPTDEIKFPTPDVMCDRCGNSHPQHNDPGLDGHYCPECTDRIYEEQRDRENDQLRERIRSYTMLPRDWQLLADAKPGYAEKAALDINRQVRVQHKAPVTVTWQEAQRAIRDTMNTWIDVGARDTEPDTVLCDVLEILWDLPPNTVTR